MTKKNETKTKEKVLSPETEEMFYMLKKRGLVSDININDKKIQAKMKEKLKDAYHNTGLLLKQYKNIAWILECFPGQIAEELDERFKDVDQLIDRLDVEMSFGNKKLENRLEGMRKTRLIIDRINEAITVLKKKPGEGERLYQVIYLTYITPENLSHLDILYRLNLSSRQYYRLRAQAFNIISIRLWSAPEQEISFWLEILSILDN